MIILTTTIEGAKFVSEALNDKALVLSAGAMYKGSTTLSTVVKNKVMLTVKGMSGIPVIDNANVLSDVIKIVFLTVGDKIDKLICCGVVFKNPLDDYASQFTVLQSTLDAKKKSKPPTLLKPKPSSTTAEFVEKMKALDEVKQAEKAKKEAEKIKKWAEIPGTTGTFEPVPGILQTVPTAHSPENMRSVAGAVAMFYVIEEMSVSGNATEQFMARRQEFLKTTCRTMLDYLAMICLVEARHAKGVKWNLYATSKSREYGWKHGVEYNPRQFLKVCEFLFNNAGWPGGYGGTAWANIAKCAHRYFTMPPAGWLDHVVDLAHNGGLAFNKGIFWHQPTGSYLKLLDLRKSHSLMDDTHQYLTMSSNELRWLTYVTGLMDEPGPSIPPLAWGEKLVTVELSKGSDYTSSDDDDDSSSDDDEPHVYHVAERIKI